MSNTNTSGNLEKMLVIAYQKKDFTGELGRYSVYINPEKYTHKYTIKYNDVQAQGSNSGSPDFNKIPSSTVDFELVFDGSGVVPLPRPGSGADAGYDVGKQIDAFKNLVFTFNGNIHSPNYLKLSWGTLLFKCRLTSLKITYTMFRPSGAPLRAKASASFIGYNDEVELALSGNKSSPDLTHIVTVVAGDTLPLMCYKIYGTSEYYTQVAVINKLTDFRNLVEGTQLVFPPLGVPPQ